MYFHRSTLGLMGCRCLGRASGSPHRQSEASAGLSRAGRVRYSSPLSPSQTSDWMFQGGKVRRCCNLPSLGHPSETTSEK